jgi:DNA-directed RNA polymerase specialized sigma24 family protein
VDRLLEEAGLDEVEKHLLIEHMLQGCTQQEFSDRHGIPLSRIGRIKDRLIGKIRRWLTGELIGESRAEFLQRLQRNKEIEETGSRH